MPCATLTVSEKPKPSVSVTSVRLDPSSVYQGDKFKIYATFTNTGSVAASAKYGVWIDNSPVGTGDVGSVIMGIPGGIPQGKSVEILIGELTANLSVGTHSVCVEVTESYQVV